MSSLTFWTEQFPLGHPERGGVQQPIAGADGVLAGLVSAADLVDAHECRQGGSDTRRGDLTEERGEVGDDQTTLFALGS
ncbi:hypothetical protein [Actinomadura macra]|uniref:hypothetical protein n=1 Tax=Actinomadura macra TaxID=46164 RepID=UPI0008335A7A|nr:hypothetical protein [Actinomadura macra]